MVHRRVSKTSGQIMWAAYRNLGHTEDDTDAEEAIFRAEVEYLRAQIRKHPARHHINDYTLSAHELGYALNDATVLKRCIAAGIRKHREEQEELARHAKRREATTHAAVVYYMRQSELVKIGTTTNIAQRLDAIGPQGVMAAEFGGRGLEVARHKEFADLRDHREWFRLEERLAEHIAAVRESFEAKTGGTVEAWLTDRIEAARRARPRPT